MTPPFRTRPSSPSVSLSHHEASISLLSVSIRGQTDWKPQSQKTNQSITCATALSNSVKLWATPCMVTQNGWVMLRSSEKCGPLEKVKVKSLSRVWLFATPCTVAYETPPSMEFSRQEYWSGLPFSSSRDLPDPGIKQGYPALQADALPSEAPGKPRLQGRHFTKYFFGSLPKNRYSFNNWLNQKN